MSHPNEAVTVRVATEADRPAVRELTWRAYAEYGNIMSPDHWQGFQRAIRSGLSWDTPVDCFVAERAGTLVGSVLLFPPATSAYGGLTEGADWPELRLLAVDPEARGSGIGRALLEACIRHAQKSGATDLGLHTSRHMAVAMAMYERMGFVRAPEYDFHPGGTETVFAYRLPLCNPE